MPRVLKLPKNARQASASTSPLEWRKVPLDTHMLRGVASFAAKTRFVPGVEDRAGRDGLVRFDQAPASAPAPATAPAQRDRKRRTQAELAARDSAKESEAILALKSKQRLAPQR
eukprot:6207965-Pleurochrysis_carterae.AAC.2